MRIGLTYDLKGDAPTLPGAPDDLQEEFDSAATIDAIANVFRDLGHQVVKLGDGYPLLGHLLTNPPDFVFNIAEGQGIGRSREARLPAVLEMLDIPYTGSDPLTLAVTLDKDCAKRLVSSYGVMVPRGAVIKPDDAQAGVKSNAPSYFPVIVKPAWEGSSKGIRNKSLVENPARLPGIIKEMCSTYQQPMLVEEFIEGDELTVGIIGNAPPKLIGVMRVLPKRQTERFVYGLEVKRDYERQVSYECPARLTAKNYQAVEQAALNAYHALGCRDVARIDFRLRDGVPYFLEVNPLPGLSPETSDLVIMARLAGWSYPQLITAVLQAALDRHAITSSSRPL